MTNDIAIIKEKYKKNYVKIEIDNILSKYHQYSQIYKKIFGNCLEQLDKDINNNKSISNIKMVLDLNLDSHEIKYVNYAIDNFIDVLYKKGYRHTINTTKESVPIKEEYCDKCTKGITVYLKHELFYK